MMDEKRASEYAILKSREREIIHNRNLAMEAITSLEDKLKRMRGDVKWYNEELTKAQRALTEFAANDKPSRKRVGK